MTTQDPTNDVPSASTMECIGLAVDSLDELFALLERVPSAEVASYGKVRLRRFRDPSGSLVQVATKKRDLLNLTPAFTADPTARVAGVYVVKGIGVADVVDDTGETATRMAFDLLQRQDAPDGSHTAIDDAAVIALGVAMSVHANEAAFAASDASALGDEHDSPRFAAESFISYGLFGSGPADPTAFLAGTVLESRTEVHSASGQRFQVARVRTVGFEATCCLPASHHPAPPPPGSVVAGTVYLVLDVPALGSK